MALLGLKLEEGAEADGATKVDGAPSEVVQLLKARQRPEAKPGRDLTAPRTKERKRANLRTSRKKESNP